MRPPALLLLAFPVLIGQPASLTTEEDHARTLRLLGIDSLRSGADGRNRQAPNAANYDESKANPFPRLPDPLIDNAGKPVRTRTQWESYRRAEVETLLNREVYGFPPPATPAVTWTVLEETVANGARTRRLAGRVDNSAYPAVSVTIDLEVTLPANARKPVPAVIELTFGARPAGLPPRPPQPGPTAKEQILARGWAHARLVPTSVQADNGAGLTQGIIGLVNHGKPRTPEQWGALRAWAWGASRALDALDADPAVDGRRVALYGHSRYGKAAAVAMAYDPRFAAAFISSSGAGGLKLHRRNWGELVENVAAPNEYHWMAGNYMKYAGPLEWDDLPVDAHHLLALCAPRPVFIGAGATEGDGWVDARGSFLAAAGATPVYRLYGRRGLTSLDFPAIETLVSGGELAFRQHSGGHISGPNWPYFLDFAARAFRER